MTLGTGPDFSRALRGWLYEAPGKQPWWVAALLLVLLFLLNSILQFVFGFVCYYIFYSSDVQFSAEILASNEFAKSSILGLMPSALLTVIAAYFAQWIWNSDGGPGLPLHLPRLGVSGWVALVAGFTVLMYLIYAGTFMVLGIDPQTYTTSAKGLNDAQSSAGLVEKAMADLASNPLLFAMAIPGVAFAVPLAEEFTFRGAFFSAIARSRLGRPGAVILSAALWSLVHGAAAPWLFVGIIFIMGLLLGLLLLRFGSLWVTIICHCVWNATSSLAIFGNVSGQ